MTILIIGASGFIGRYLYQSLKQQGYHVIGCSRQKVTAINWQFFDFDQSQEDWKKQLKGIDLVINAAGIYQQSQLQRFEKIHAQGPKRLFSACSHQNIRVLQISAIGAEQSTPASAFLQSKRNADQYLLNQTATQETSHVVLYPGIVLGERGKTARQLSILAHSYYIPLVFGKQAKLPLVSIFQLSDFIIELLEHWPKENQQICLLAREESMEYLFKQLRQWMHLGTARFIYIPQKLSEILFYCFPKLSIGVFNKQSIEMLAAYSSQNLADKTISPISDKRLSEILSKKLSEKASDSLLQQSASGYFITKLRHKILFYINIFILSLIWIMSGISSLVNMDQSREIIALMSIHGQWADILITGASIIDILLGLFIWAGSAIRKWVLYMQLSVMLIYSLILTLFIPVFWLHPFAPIIKNLALLVLALYLLIDEKN